jgi:hypothetical protein
VNAPRAMVCRARLDRELRAYKAAGFVHSSLKENAGTAIFLIKP